MGGWDGVCKIPKRQGGGGWFGGLWWISYEGTKCFVYLGLFHNMEDLSDVLRYHEFVLPIFSFPSKTLKNSYKVDPYFYNNRCLYLRIWGRLASLIFINCTRKRQVYFPNWFYGRCYEFEINSYKKIEHQK